MREDRKMTIGFIGLGIMGAPMLRNLLKAGHSAVAYDIVSSQLDAIVAEGAERGASSREVASRSIFTITMLPDGPQVEQAVLGEGGALEGAKPGSLLIDMSSINPLISQKIAIACMAKGVEFLDAPVSGGEPKASDGTLAIMVGGKAEVYEKPCRRGERDQASQPDHGGLQYCRDGRGAGVVDTVWPRPRRGSPRREERTRG
jgi:2-hydroxy-3-oxopropionate reductase